MRTLSYAVFCLVLSCLQSLGQTTLQNNVIYVCNDGQSFKVFSCNDQNGACDYQNYKHGQAFQRGEALRAQLAVLIPAKCHAQTPAEAKADPHQGEIAAAPSPFKARAAASAAPADTSAVNPPPGAFAGPGPFKVGDTVRVLSSGWQDAKILQVHGNSYFVQLENGIQVSKSWPMEVRREGKLTAADHALGQWDLREKVQVQVDGRWREGIIVAQDLNRYRVQFPDLNTVDTGAENLRASTAAPSSVRGENQAPKAGLTSCNGKYEGRWEHVSGMGGMEAVFRGRNVTVTEGLGGPMQFECWLGDGKIVLYKAGSSTPFSYGFDINNDGTLQTPLGAIKKMGN